MNKNIKNNDSNNDENTKKEEEGCVLFLSCVYCGTKVHADRSDHRSNTNLLSFKEKNENVNKTRL